MNENEDYNTINGFRYDKSKGFIYISSLEPTSEDGNDGDIWIKYDSGE